MNGYLVYKSATKFHHVRTLHEAIDLKVDESWLIYEPLGLLMAKKVTIDDELLEAAREVISSSIDVNGVLTTGRLFERLIDAVAAGDQHNRDVKAMAAGFEDGA